MKISEAERKDREAMKKWNEECDRIFENYLRSNPKPGDSPKFPPAPKPPGNYEALPYYLAVKVHQDSLKR